MSFLIILLFGCGGASAGIIQSSNQVDWTLGGTVGVTVAIPNRTNLVDVTADPFNADKTGATDATSAINAAIAYSDAAGTNVVYLPAGKYVCNGELTLNKSGITIRGAGSNSIIAFTTDSATAFQVGHDSMSGDANRGFIATNGCVKGSTNMILSKVQNNFGDTVKAGDLLSIVMETRNIGNDQFPVISVEGFDGIIKQSIYVTSKTGNAITFWPPLVWTFATNSVQVGLGEVDTIALPRTNIGIENLTITGTNYGTGTKLGADNIFLINATCLQNCWFTNVNLQFANNYQLYLTFSANCDVRDSWVRDALSSGTSHAGVILANDSGILVQNNIFSGAVLSLSPAIEINDGVMCCAFFGNYFTSCSQDVYTHNTHPMMNVFEQNKFFSFFEMDGYFGSASHYTMFRNLIWNTLPLKRFISNMQVVGNVNGNIGGGPYQFFTQTSGYGSPFPLFELGFPNIGNSTFVGISPPIAWNFPGRSYTSFSAAVTTNGAFTATGTYGPTNVIWTNMGVGALTNIPASSAGVNYPLMFQDGVNPNFYAGSLDGSSIISSTGGTASNVTLSTSITLSNGQTIFIVGQNAYQQLQASNRSSDNITGNYLFTNGIGNPGTLSFDTVANAETNLPVSYLYLSAPTWWGTNHWPAIDPTNTVNVVYSIPAENRYFGINDQLPNTDPPTSPGISPSTRIGITNVAQSFTAFFTGSTSNLWYQWNTNGVNQASANNSTLSFTSPIAGTNQLQIIITNLYGATTSAVASAIFTNAQTIPPSPGGIIFNNVHALNLRVLR